MHLKLDIAARYQPFELVANGAFDLSGVTALFGPSGSGKTTVLDAIGGFRPGLGLIEVDGNTWDDGTRWLPAHRRPAATVFQDGRLFEHLSVDGNLAYAERRAAPAGPPISRADVIDATGLAPLLSRSPQTLSGGENRRAAIARALLARPSLLLLDEPLSGLDRPGKSRILRLIGELPQRFGVSVVYVSHLVEEIVQISEQLIAIRDGRFVGSGPTVSMLEALGPDVTGHFEAGSLLEGRVIGYDEQFQMTTIDVGAGMLMTPDITDVAVGARVRVRLRSRDLSLSLDKLNRVSIRNQLPVSVLDIAAEPGAYAEVTLDCGGQKLRARLTRIAVSELGLEPGTKAYALIKSVAFDRRLY